MASNVGQKPRKAPRRRNGGAPNGILFDGWLRVPGDVFVLENFRRWAHSRQFPQRGKISFLGGEIDIDMSPEEIETHNKIKTIVTVELGALIVKLDLGDLLSDGAFLVNEAADLANEPDLMFCSWETLLSGRVRYAERVKGSRRFVEVIGSPDLVVEIVSQHSVRKDTTQLLARYFSAGIPEYWLIDARGAEIDFRIYTRGAKEYVAVAADAKGFVRSAVVGRRFKLTRDRNRVGGYRYSLLQR